MAQPQEPKTPTTEDLIREEALRIAKGIQKPGQTKEQTKLVAQGIAKGIALYKKQQSAKARERDKARKRAVKLKAQENSSSDLGDGALDDIDASGNSARLAAGLGGILLCALAVLLGGAAFGLASFVLAATPMPTWAAGVAAVLFGIVGIWNLIGAFKGGPEPDAE